MGMSAASRRSVIDCDLTIRISYSLGNVKSSTRVMGKIDCNPRKWGSMLVIDCRHQCGITRGSQSGLYGGLKSDIDGEKECAGTWPSRPGCVYHLGRTVPDRITRSSRLPVGIIGG